MSSNDASADTAESGAAPVPPRGIALVGPTASGKTALSLALARRLPGEVVSMDSRQVYRGMDIGTAKATAEERAAVPHHGLDLIPPTERYSAGRFARDARSWIRDIRGRDAVPLLVGGTGFFLRALTEPLFREPPMDVDRRRTLDRVLRQFDTTVLKGWLDALDPETASSLAGGGGRQRLLRALEVPLLTGRSLSWWHRNAPAAEPPVPLRVFVLELPRELLDRRIDERVLAMVDAGLVDEVRTLLDAGVPADAPGMTATGYRELAAHLRGELTLAEAIERIRRATRQYARRQLTWYRNQLPTHAVRLDATRPADELAARIIRDWEGVQE